MSQPYHSCPSFIDCSCNKCPLDPEMDSRIAYFEDEKCRAGKSIRMKIGFQYPNLLKYKGLTAKEYVGKKRFGTI